MAMTKVTVSGLATSPVATPTAAAASDTIAVVAGATYALLVINGNAAATTVTIDDVNTVSPPNAVAFNADMAQIVSGTTNRIIWIRDTGRFTTAGGLITVTFSAIVTVTYYLFELL